MIIIIIIMVGWRRYGLLLLLLLRGISREWRGGRERGRERKGLSQPAVGRDGMFYSVRLGCAVNVCVCARVRVRVRYNGFVCVSTYSDMCVMCACVCLRICVYV